MISMGEVVSAVVQKNMPLKQKDSCAFTIPCVIGNASFKMALCDLDASISVMPKHVYDSLSMEPLNKTNIVIQLADRSFVYPLGVIKDVLVKISSLIIPCDFYIFLIWNVILVIHQTTLLCCLGDHSSKLPIQKLIVVSILCPWK